LSRGADQRLFDQSKAPCGAARQHAEAAGKITSRQIGAFAAHVSRHGHALINHALHLAEGWTDDPVRRAPEAKTATARLGQRPTGGTATRFRRSGMGCSRNMTF
jgi:SRSO17 transposase